MGRRASRRAFVLGRAARAGGGGGVTGAVPLAVSSRRRRAVRGSGTRDSHSPYRRRLVVPRARGKAEIRTSRMSNVWRTHFARVAGGTSVAISKGSKVKFADGARVNDPVPVPGTACTGFVVCGISREIARNGMRGPQPDDSPETRCARDSAVSIIGWTTVGDVKYLRCRPRTRTAPGRDATRQALSSIAAAGHDGVCAAPRRALELDPRSQVQEEQVQQLRVGGKFSRFVGRGVRDLPQVRRLAAPWKHGARAAVSGVRHALPRV